MTLRFTSGCHCDHHIRLENDDDSKSGNNNFESDDDVQSWRDDDDSQLRRCLFNDFAR